MKKRILALLVASLLLVSMMPTVGMAALQYASCNLARITFDTLTKNTATVSGVEGTAPADGWRLSGAGTGVDFEPVTGMFGKAETDVSLKATRITSSTDEAFVGPVAKQTAYNAPAAGEYINMNWEWAFGDMNVERYVNAKFYNTSSFKWNEVNSFSYTAGGESIADILRISPNGAVRFFGQTLETPYFFELNTWYNFDIRIKCGTNTDTANEVAGTKAIAYLYVDGILIGEKEINDKADSDTTINNPYGIYRIELVSKGVKYAEASEANTEVSYVDDLYSGKYKSSGNHIGWRWMRDYTITSKSDNFITDGLHIALKNPMTASELKADLSYIAGDDTGIGAITIVDANRAALADDVAVTPGCFIKVKTKSNGQWHYYYRKIVDNIYYVNNSFEGSAPAAAPTSLFKTEFGSYSQTVNYTIKRKSTPVGVTQAFEVDKYGSNYAGALAAKANFKYQGEVKADKYVVEMSILRDAVSDDYVPSKFRVNGQTVADMNGDRITVKTDDNSWPVFIRKSDRFDNRWVKFAVEVDNVEKTAKIYINGEYTGVTRTKWDGANWYSNIGVLTDATDKLESSFGKTHIDDIKVYSGTYSDGLNVTSNSDKIVIASNDTIKLEEDVTAEELIAATGADAIYSYADGEFGDQITSGVLPGDAVAVFKSDDTNIVKYYDIVYAPVMGDVEFDTSVEGKISAKVTFDNNSDLDMYKDAKLIIASYDNSGKGKKLSAVDVFAKNDMIVGTNELTATIDFDESKEIVAYLWKANGAPYVEAVPYIG